MGFERDILLLSHMPPVMGLISAPHNKGVDPHGASTTDMWRGRLEMIFTDILQSNAHYGAARLINIESEAFDMAKSVKHSSSSLASL